MPSLPIKFGGRATRPLRFLRQKGGSIHSALAEVIGLFLKLGFTAFGGPAAHIGIMHDEVVRRRKWLSEEQFLDLIGATNLIPGPNSTEMVIHIGYLRAGWPGLIAAGACFIFPAMAITTALAWAYVRYGATPQASFVLGGVQPVIIVIILQALTLLGRKALKDSLTWVIAIAALGLALLRINEVFVMFGGGILGMFAYAVRRGRRSGAGAILPLAGLSLPSLASVAAAVAPFSLGTLFLTFIKIGAVLYGSGYVLLAFLRADFVERLGWITEAQLLDAIAIGQLTPGPLFTSATFIGYLLGGPWAGVVATFGIFLPAFVFVAVSNPLIPRLRASPWTAGFLDSIIAASLGLMAAVTLQLGYAALRTPLAIGLAGAAALLLFRFRVNTMALVGGAAVIGLLVGIL